MKPGPQGTRYKGKHPDLSASYGLGIPHSRLHPGGWEPAPRWSLWRLVGYDLIRRVYEDIHQTHLFTERGRSKKVARASLYSMFAQPITAGRAENEELSNDARGSFESIRR